MATPNMLLTLPVVGVTAGPTYATQVNAALTVVDQHDHSSGSGVQITPSGLNISSDLSFQSNDAVDLRTARFTAQASALPGTTPDLACLYVVGDNLYYNDGSGNQIAMTASGSIAGASGNITGLVAPASVVYTAGGAPNFKFMSTALASADLDAAQLILRNPVVTATYGLTLAAPTLSSNYSITLPALPVATSFMTIDSSGTMTNTIPTSLGIDTANIAAGAVTAAKLATDSVTTIKIVDANVTPAKLSFDPATAEVRVAVTATGTLAIPAGVSTIRVLGIGGGGGGSSGFLAAGANGGGGGGSGGLMGLAQVAVNPAGETISITIGAGGAGGSNASSPASLPGSNGSTTTVSGSLFSLRFLGGLGAPAVTVAGTGASGGASYYVGGLSNSAGGAGGSGTLGNGVSGDVSLYAGVGANGTGGPSGCGGGSGGAGLGASGAGAQGTGSLAGGSATANSGAGGGGGGGSTSAAPGPGGDGGSGVVYVSYVPVV